jgi:hypothetical protein
MRHLPVTMIIAALFLVSSGCESMHSGPDSSEGVSPPPASARAGSTSGSSLEFDDILIPSDLTPVNNERYFFENDKFKTGLMSFEGRVDMTSLADFFMRNMAKDGWTNTTAFKAPTTVLIFDKPTKSAMIKISEGSWYTHVEVLVIELKSTQSSTSGGYGYSQTPRLGGAGSDSMREGALTQ